jgi:hypothetical protein
MHSVSKYLILAVAITTLFIEKANSQNQYYHLNDTLNQLSYNILNNQSDIQKLQSSEQLITRLTTLLKSESGYNYSFDSVPYISVLQPKNKQFRLLTWNLPFTDGTYRYFGLCVKKNKSGIIAVKLHDQSDVLPNPEHSILKSENWYGALYYKLIETGKGKQQVYTLLGWDGNSKAFKRKIIDVLSFDSEGNPLFGKAIFNSKDKKRIFFEYAPDAAFKLRYEIQGHKVKRWYSSGFSIVKDEMIVFDRLEPINPGITNSPQFMVPSGNIIDAYIFSDDKWRLLKDIDARNPESPYDNIQRPKPSLKLTPDN